MNVAVTLTPQEFSDIHNALCFANSRGLEATVEAIRTALDGAYQQEKQDFDNKFDYYNRFKQDNNLTAIWSIYSTPIHGFLADHPYASHAVVFYKNRHVAVWGNTWADIYRAADQAIRNSGDEHHIYIEDFVVKNGHELHLVTGS